MAQPPRTPASRRRATASPQAVDADATVAQVAALAWAGQHEPAVALASAALATEGLNAATQIALLDLRAESRIALGNLLQASADAEAMLGLAGRARSVALQAQALNRMSVVQMRRGEHAAALSNATAACEAARRSGRPMLEAMSLTRLGAAQNALRAGFETTISNAARAAALFAAGGETANQGRAVYLQASALTALGRGGDADLLAEQALALALKSGDLLGQGTALNLLTFNIADQAAQLKLYLRALAAFRAAGYVISEALVMGNLGLCYASLGLYRRARRVTLEAVACHRRSGAQASLANALWNLAPLLAKLGEADAARAAAAEAQALTTSLGLRRYNANAASLATHLALRERRTADAVRDAERAVSLVEPGEDSTLMDALADLGRAHLAAGQPAKALAATRRAVALHQAQGLTAADGIDRIPLWRRHSQALRANRRLPAARKALQQAYRFLREGIASLGDEGLRRNFLNKDEDTRALVCAWLADAAARGLPRAEREAHLAGAAHLHEPFQRLVDTGLRLNELQSSEALQEFLIEEATELLGAERVLLLVKTSDGLPPDGLRLAGAQLPHGEDAAALLQAVRPWLLEAGHSRAVALRHGPEGAEPVEQRSCLVAPLIAQRELLGYLYCDIEGAFGRFHDADRDLLAMLAAQAAVALANLRFAAGLEQKVAERTAQLEQRAGELAVINSIQQGMAAELDFQAIVDLVGDKLREVFKTGDLGINWWDENTRLLHHLYSYEHGVRLRFAAPLAAGGRDGR